MQAAAAAAHPPSEVLASTIAASSSITRHPLVMLRAIGVSARPRLRVVTRRPIRCSTDAVEPCVRHRRTREQVVRGADCLVENVGSERIKGAQQQKEAGMKKNAHRSKTQAEQEQQLAKIACASGRARR